eukprot:Clim_evm9s223 gene=Clim_evmTU9s223
MAPGRATTDMEVDHAGPSSNNKRMKMTEEERRKHLPWVEKYRPQKLEDLISHEDIVSTIKKFMEEDRLPHLLFYGPPGTGKTSTILACAKQMYGARYNSMILELNASDDRGIDVVREQIKEFASTRTVFSSGYKLIVLDEADNMTNAAQAALRRIIEKYTKNTRFCLICNYVSKIIPALQSRCTRFRFAPLKEEQMTQRLQEIVTQESVNITEDGKEALIRLSGGDMRRTLNILQSCYLAYDEVNATNVYLCTGHPLPEDIDHIVEVMLRKSFAEAYEEILQLKTAKGLALVDIITEAANIIYRLDLPSKAKIDVIDKMAEIEYNLSTGTNEKIQFGALLGAFQHAKAIITKQ